MQPLIVEKITTMTISFGIGRILGDRPFAEVGDPVLAVDDEGRGLLAVAGAHVAVAGVHGFGSTASVGVYAETHFAGPGVETSDGDLIHAGTVHHGHGLQPGGSFVVRRAVTSGEPTWVFRTDRKATDSDHDTETVYVTYDDGEIAGLDLRDGNVRWRRHLAVAGVPVVPTALTVAEPGRLLIGTTDGRILDCSIV
ncbi:PQQ-binding-like beta-propeller repeat protein [Streptomyces sp. NPDC057696]|uniref:outer membrane protein assembly factor BamB family protein n=1 Tax=Streptomyces sp. NPDC057696 TaxID=3346218 RepID=UPI00367DC602